MPCQCGVEGVTHCMEKAKAAPPLQLGVLKLHTQSCVTSYVSLTRECPAPHSHATTYLGGGGKL